MSQRNVRRGGAVAVAAVVIAGLAVVGAGTAVAEPESAASFHAVQTTQDRIAGDNRWDTAARIAVRLGGAPVVIVANGEDTKQGFDALAANYLAGVMGAPIVLTAATALPEQTARAVRQTLEGAPADAGLQIVVMGKADSVSNAVVTELNAIAQDVAGDEAKHWVRIAGDSRYETAVAAATLGGDGVNGAAVGRFSIGDDSAVGKTAFLASGTSNADALAAGPISNALGIPVYLTLPDVLDPLVVDALGSQGIANLIVLGGAERVSAAVVAQAQSAGVTSVTRIAGANRFDTAAKLYDFAASTLTAEDGSHYGSEAGQVYLANGLTGFPDALAVGPLAAAQGAALLTTSANRLEPLTSAYLAANPGRYGGITALGQTATVSESALNAALALLG